MVRQLLSTMARLKNVRDVMVQDMNNTEKRTNVGHETYAKLHKILFNAEMSYVELLGICSLLQNDLLNAINKATIDSEESVLREKQERPTYVG